LVAGLLGVADDAGFVDVFAGEADIGGGWLRVLLGNARKIVAQARNLAPLLRRVVLVGVPEIGYCRPRRSRLFAPRRNQGAGPGLLLYWPPLPKRGDLK
jgi:hypothetical protein